METDLNQFKAHLSVFSGSFDVEAVQVVVRPGEFESTLRSLDQLVEAGDLEATAADHGRLYRLLQPSRVPHGKSWQRLCDRHLFHYAHKAMSSTLDGSGKADWLQTNAANVSVALARCHRFVLEFAALPAASGEDDRASQILRAALSIVRVGLWSQTAEDTTTAAKLLLDIRRSRLWETLDERSQQETNVYLRYVHGVKSHSVSQEGLDASSR